MAKIKDVYKCDVCGIIVEVTHGGGGTLSCCGKPMRLIVENTVDAAVEKHIPAVEKNGDEIIVKVGSVEHPMTEQHYIEWIEVNTENKVYRKFLTPEDKPEAVFKSAEEVISAKAYCNLHGLWTANL